MKIAIIGYGKMGKAIEKTALSKNHEVILRVNKENPLMLNDETLSQVDVAVEFSRPGSAFKNISACLEMGIPVVSGTTGWMDQVDEAKALCLKNNGAFLYASNFSIGVNIFFALNKHLAKLMQGHPQYDVSIEEIHHVQKSDYPSGTAITLAEGILENSLQKDSWKGQMKKVGAQHEEATLGKELLITSKRIDSLPGTHFVRWSSGIDQLEISHVAHSREGFAEGALAAAEWLKGRKGCFGMEDMLGL